MWERGIKNVISSASDELNKDGGGTTSFKHSKLFCFRSNGPILGV